ncbi:MAG: cytochrome c peroxidase [Bacteroidota bacterium]
MKGRLPLLLLVVLLATLSCEREELNIKYEVYLPGEYEVIQQYLNLPRYPLKYEDKFPSFSENTDPILFHDRNMAALGRVLFYDENLSEDRTISCASCHKQELAFADDKALSEGVSNRVTARNSIALGSVFSFKQHYGGRDRIAFFWDNRASSVKSQTIETFSNPEEMNISMREVVERVKEQPYYDPLFRAAFGSDHKSSDKVLQAITVFINSMGSFNSKYDQVLEGYFKEEKRLPTDMDKSLAGLALDENIGRNLYNKNCASCHGRSEKDSGRPNFAASNNGLYSFYEDTGIGALSNRSRDDGKFKVPSLRNVVLTAPYMHDGSLATLDDVLEHYSSGIKNYRNLDPILKTGSSPKRMNFTSNDKKALTAFLNTLTDESFLKAEKYSDPFK